jgi:hypothetical protein
MPLDWAADGEEDEVPLLAILDASVIRSDFPRARWHYRSHQATSSHLE